MSPDKTSAKVNAQNDVFLYSFPSKYKKEKVSSFFLELHFSCIDVQDFINVPEEFTVKDHLQISLLILSKIKRIN